MDPGPTISRSYTRHKWVGRMICSQAILSAHAQDLLRLPESMTIIKNRTDNLRFSFPLFSDSLTIDSIKETVYQGTLNPLPKALFVVMIKHE